MQKVLKEWCVIHGRRWSCNHRCVVVEINRNDMVGREHSCIGDILINTGLRKDIRFVPERHNLLCVKLSEGKNSNNSNNKILLRSNSRNETSTRRTAGGRGCLVP